MLVEPDKQYLPGVQLPEHTALGSADDCPYCPAGHGTQRLEPATPNCPGPHTAAVALVDPATQ